MKKPVPFVDFSRIHLPLREEILQRISRVIDRGAFVLGDEVSQFEKDYATWTGTKHCVGVNSGLDALEFAFRAVGVKEGDEVIVPANTFIATALAVSHAGATPVLVDVEADTCNLDPNLIEKAITKKTKAIAVVHLYGQPATMEPIMEVARKHGLKVIEDCAQAHGALYKGKMIGTWGDIGCFSFYPTKNLGAMGEGGAIVTNEMAYAEKVLQYRNVGQKEKNNHVVLGHNSRLHTVQAAVLLAKLPHLHKHNELRQDAAAWYSEAMGNVPELTLPRVRGDRNHVYHLYVVHARSVEDREALKSHLGAQQIGCAVHYPIPIHMQPVYANLAKSPGAYPVAERSAQVALSLPMFPGMTAEEVKTVAAAVKEFYASRGTARKAG